MRHWILALILAMLFSCSNNNDTASQNESPAIKAYDLKSAKGLCFYVMDKADQASGDKAVEKIVTDAYRTTTCPKLTDDLLPLWQCMKQQLDNGEGFGTADEFCTEKF